MKKIRLHGFKSFGDRLEIAFEQGITAVVGPNGSGKSNIADALRWVLGEGSAKALRGVKMEDVIFAGSERRKGLGMAEVTLLLDNSSSELPIDFTDVSVTRRVFRSGESEFLINNSACRLKDIHELFMDSGLGKDAYSLLSQSDVDAILSVRPEDRRRFLDEAAGITRFKSKKQEALRKLEDTQQNLVRVGDILQELGKQVEPLARQAKKAQRYQELAGELRHKEVGLLGSALQEAVARWERDQEELTRSGALATEASTALATAETRLEELRLAATNAALRREELARSILEVSTDLEKLETRIQVAREKQRRWTEEEAGLDGEMQRRREAVRAAEKHCEEARSSLAARQGEIAVAAAELAAKEAEYARLTSEVVRLESQVENLKGELIEALNQTSQLRNSAHNLVSERDNIERQLAKAREAETECQAAQAAASGRLEQLKREYERKQQSLAAKNEEIAAQDETIKRLRLEIQSTESELRGHDQAHNRVSSRLAALSELAKSHEGYFEGVRSLMSGSVRASFPGILGPVADLVKVGRAHETAVEVALGSGLQNIVVDTESTAKRAVAYLKEHRAGRATFLPLDTLRANTCSREDLRQAERVAGFVNSAVELLSFQAQLRPALEYLLGRTLVAENMQAATEVARATGYRYTVVTLDGDLVRPGGAITGGQLTEKSRGLLSRPREIDELRGQLGQLEGEGRALGRRLADCKSELDAVLERREGASTERRDLELALLAESKDIEAAQLECRRLDNTLETNRAEAARLAAELSDDGASRRIADQVEAAEAARQDLERSITEAQASLKEAVAARERSSTLLTEAKVAAATLEQVELGVSSEVRRLEAELGAAERALAGLDAEAKNIAARAKEAQDEESEAVGARGRLSTTRVQLEDDMTAVATARERLAAQNEELENLVKEERRRAAERQEEAHRLELAVTKVEMEIEVLAGRLSEEYGMSKDDAMQVEPLAGDREAAATAVDDLKRKIAVLGNVNLDSIEEYEQVKERYTFLSKQRKDLVEARDALLKAIEEIQRTTERRFQETFDAVHREFTALFADIFGGGQAELTLTDPDDLSETGIEIYAQPPGKKPQSLLLLSTGERTLTAIALLLAIFRVKPSPFCLLDEVDAALDEANLSRFVGLLQRFAERTQFIVITHRRRTMEAANVLYGVTMEELGVSKMVSVRLEDVR